MATLRWGILGCGDVAEYKGGPPLYSVNDSELIAVMRRDGAKAESFAERHGAKRFYTDIDDLLADDELNAIYIATHPTSTANTRSARRKPVNISSARNRWR